ncbi:hypothetical protein SAMN05192564_102300 [Paraburkholderia sartisoli]|uniref:Uncharacterized protein n=1 Tax=Paraburkholderia sartisoli TaxID=83784 RepID=A0A1H4CGF1_9BURK|nr:hypothetical protein SAMN05192564_102300 [Paraburkholderia sartisoli]
MAESADVIVIGSGGLGAATACYLDKRGTPRFSSGTNPAHRYLYHAGGRGPETIDPMDGKLCTYEVTFSRG